MPSIPELPRRWKWKLRTPAEMPKEIRHKLAYTETTVLGGQIHQAVMYEPIFTTFVGLIAFLVVVPRVPPDANGVIDFMLLGFVALLLRLAWKWIEWTYSLFFFTTYRIIYMHGIVTRQIAMLPMGKVTDMGYNRSPNGQLFGYGTFIIESAGQEQALRTLNYVPDPDQTYKQVVDWLFGKGTTNVNIIDVNMLHPNKSIPVNTRNRQRTGPEAGPEGEERRAWWND
jgi:membrane protein YdbS with pleckstrin-like domain